MCVLLRKFTLSGVIIFLLPGQPAQVGIAVALAGMFLAMQIKLQPYEDNKDDNLDTTALLAIFLTLLAGLLLKSGQSGSGITIFVLMVNLTVFVVILYELFFEIIPTMIENAQRKVIVAKFVAKRIEEKEREEEQARRKQKQFQQDSEDSDEESNENSGDDNVTRLIRTYFERYDLDNSGTINTTEELHQLCTNLCFKLQNNGFSQFTLTEINHHIQTVEEVNENNAWDFDRFDSWFKGTFTSQN